VKNAFLESDGKQNTSLNTSLQLKFTGSVKYNYSQQRKDSSLDTQPHLLVHSTSMEIMDYQGGKQNYDENFIFQSPT
jgi:hypothetical protein